MSRRVKIIFLITIAVVLSSLFLVYNLPNKWQYAFEKRSFKLASIFIVSCSVAYSSIAFQTLTQNKILTPSIMGFEAVYFLFQTIIVFVYGDKTFSVINQSENFFVSILLMLLFALVLFVFLFRRKKQHLFVLLLIGVVLSTLFGTISSFLQLIIDPNEFLMFQMSMFASFNNINYKLFWYAMVVMTICFSIGIKRIKYLDVISLGRETAINLGVDYFGTVRLYLFIIATLVAVSTALVGPITFLGILVTNLTYVLFKTYKHNILIPMCCLISFIAVCAGQFFVEHIFSFNTTVSIIINFLGGIYFIYLLLKTKKI